LAWSRVGNPLALIQIAHVAGIFSAESIINIGTVRAFALCNKPSVQFLVRLKQHAEVAQ
jgi:hypothetical protein